MVNLAQLTQSNSYAQTSGPGFGTRMLCRRLNEHASGPVDASMWLSGLRRANALSMNTNDIPNAHMRSPGGFIEFFAGLTDPGDIQFEACWKNDVPAGATARSIAAGEIDFQRWQAPREVDVGVANQEGFFHSIFYDRQPFEAWVIPPQWTRGLILVRGYAKMVGPFPHEMEGVINFQGAFKASGKPMLLRGTKGNTVGTPGTGVAILAAAVSATQVTGIDSGNAENKRYRAVSSDFLTELWTNVGDGATVPAWAEAGPAKAWTIYEYTEDEGFGEAF